MKERFLLAGGIFFVSMFFAPVHAQALFEDTELYRPQSGFREEYRPTVHAHIAPSLPVGYLADIFPFGAGANLAFTLRLPWKFLQFSEYLDWSAGATAGYYFFMSEVDDSSLLLQLIPFTADVRLVFRIPPLAVKNFFPYISTGTGASYTVGSREEHLTGITLTGTSIDYTYLIGGGFSYDIPEIPAMEYVFNLQYLLAAERELGHFLNISLGVAYEL